MNLSPSVTAAASRFLAILIALGAAISIVIFVPDPTLKTVGAGLAAAAVLALEEYLKNSGASAPATPAAVVSTTVIAPPVKPSTPAPILAAPAVVTAVPVPATVAAPLPPTPVA